VTCHVAGLSGSARQTLDGMGVLAKLRPGSLFPVRLSALKQAAQELPHPAG